MKNHLVNEILSKYVKKLNSNEFYDLFSYTSNLPLHIALFGEQAKDERLIRQRLASWTSLLSNLKKAESELRVGLNPINIWSYPLIISQFIKNHPAMIFSIIGSPGAGKTTLANLVVKCLQSLDPGSKVLRISLEDFYFSKNIRKKRVIKWRALPGSHDIESCIQLLREIKNGKKELIVPRFDFNKDDSGEHEVVKGPISTVIFEGWFIGKNDLGYEKLNEFIDYRIFLDCDIEIAKRRRFSRESEINIISDGLGGFSKTELDTFWDEVLKPGINEWVLPLRSTSNLIIELGHQDWEIVTAKRND